jgi:hypothetical protein
VLASTLIHLYEQYEKYAVDVLGVVPTLPEQLRETLLAPSNWQNMELEQAGPARVPERYGEGCHPAALSVESLSLPDCSDGTR